MYFIRTGFCLYRSQKLLLPKILFLPNGLIFLCKRVAFVIIMEVALNCCRQKFVNLEETN